MPSLSLPLLWWDCDAEFRIFLTFVVREVCTHIGGVWFLHLGPPTVTSLSCCDGEGVDRWRGSDRVQVRATKSSGFNHASLVTVDGRGGDRYTDLENLNTNHCTTQLQFIQILFPSDARSL